MKFYDTTQSAAAIDSTAENMLSINLIPQGVTESTRVGRKCTIRRITCKGYIRWDPAGMGASTYSNAQIRYLLVLDKQANGANPAWTDVYEDTSVNSPRNLANVGRFKVLKDWHFTPAFGAVISGGANIAAPMTKFKFNKKVNIPLEFNASTGAITELRSNNLTLMAVSNAGDDTHTVTSYWRVSYTD